MLLAQIAYPPIPIFEVGPLRLSLHGLFAALGFIAGGALATRYLARRGYASAGYAELDVEELGSFEVPAIVPISLKGYDHFVVFRGRYGDRVVLADPAFGNLTMSTTRFMEIWKGGIGFVVKDVERHDAGVPLDVTMLPFPKLSPVYRQTSRSGFRRIQLP